MSSLPTPTRPHRLERLRARLAEERLDGAVLFGPDHVLHLGGYRRYGGRPSALLVGRDGERTLVVSALEAEAAREASGADGVVSYGERSFGLDLDPVPKLVAAVAGLPLLARARRLAVASELPGAEALLADEATGAAVAADEIVRRLRLVKDEDELADIRASYELCWQGQRAVAEAARPGAPEIELFTAAQAAAQLAAGEPIEFLCDLLSGPNTAGVAAPARVAGRRQAERGDPVVADVVVRFGGYWGDSCETHLVGGGGDAEAVRTQLLSVLRGAAGLLVPGAACSAVYRELRDRILSAFPGGELPHHGGHGVGLTPFEDPHLIPTDDTPLEPGMVLAVEPGVYFRGRFGARVENLFVVTPAGGVELREAFRDRQASMTCEAI